MLTAPEYSKTRCRLYFRWHFQRTQALWQVNGWGRVYIHANSYLAVSVTVFLVTNEDFFSHFQQNQISHRKAILWDLSTPRLNYWICFIVLTLLSSCKVCKVNLSLIEYFYASIWRLMKFCYTHVYPNSYCRIVGVRINRSSMKAIALCFKKWFSRINQ